MVCHSRAANWVLGLTEVQMNRDFDYGGVRENQLRAFERIGLFKVDWSGEARNRMRDELKAKGLKDKDIDSEMEKRTATRNQREPVPSSLLTVPPDKYR